MKGQGIGPDILHLHCVESLVSHEFTGEVKGGLAVVRVWFTLDALLPSVFYSCGQVCSLNKAHKISTHESREEIR